MGVGLGMSPILQDSRILTICMMLRHLNPICNPASHIRICSENNVDQTAALALTPQRTGNNVQKFPDFINTQAIYARALTLALAYPGMLCAMIAYTQLTTAPCCLYPCVVQTCNR